MMLRRLDRYMLRTFLGPFALSLAFFVGMYVIIDTAEKITKIMRFTGETGLAGLLARYHLYSLPVVLPRVTPAMTLIAVVIALTRLSRHNELLAMKAVGVSMQRAVVPLVAAAFVIGALVAGLQELTLPHVAGKMQQVTAQLMGSGGDDPEVYDDIWVVDSEGNVLHARSYHSGRREFTDGELIEAAPDPQLHGVPRITSGIYDRRNKVWLLTGTRYWRDEDGTRLRKEEFRDLPWQTDLTPAKLIERRFDSDFRSAGQLMRMANLMDTQEALGAPSGKLMLMKQRRLWTWVHGRVSLPFATVALVLIGLPLVLRDETRSAMVGIGLAVLICAAFYATHLMLLDLGGRPDLGLKPWVAGWGSTAIFAALGVYNFRRIAS
jgi:lipopolysaccharide export system permease protein